MSEMGFIAENQVMAGSSPPKRLPLPRWRSGPEQSSEVLVPSFEAWTAAAYSAVNPRNDDDLLASLVPVLPDTGCPQPVAPAASAAVPAPTESLDMATDRVSARPGSITCSHSGSASSTGLPVRSVMDSM